ncbi:hypothetical protein [Flavobacterium sp. ov086]|uniref:hypothetical protein n=1 Tax=Flavobacterium sp. ov086 TaxID=1761785 RepID=UPI000B73FFA5|nr:hypothetical protein [Flavobacterium sp. ov086]SNR35038.1 hypothetical protein SAMN04487979_103344 [Flavobacterium sp. ov086]
MTKRILFLFFFFLTLLGKAQNNPEVKVNVEDLVSNYIKQLNSRKIDTMCVYENYCVGSIKIYEASLLDSKDFCMEDFPNDPVYIFWIDNGRKKMTKISICSEYAESLDDDNIFWHMYFPNKDIIKKEEIKRFQYKTSKKEIYTMMRDHSCHQNLKFIIGNQIIEKRFDFFNLIKEEDAKVNINYNHNTNLKSKRLIDLLEKVTSEAEKNNTFKKIKSR